MRALLLAFLFFMIAVPAAYAQNQGTLNVQVGDQQVTVTATGYIPLLNGQDGHCCSYFRVYRDSIYSLDSQEGTGAHAYEGTFPKGSLSQGNHHYELRILTPIDEDLYISQDVNIDNTPQISASISGDTAHPFDILGTVHFADNGSNWEGYVKLDSWNKFNTKDFGQQSVYLQGSDVNWAWSSDFGSQGTIIYPGNLVQGEHYVEYWGHAYNGAESAKQYLYYTIDNTPTLSVNPVESPEGPYDVTGTVGFIQTSPSYNWGTLAGAITNLSGTVTKASFTGKPFNTNSTTWSFAALYGSALNASTYAPGTYKVKMTATAKNGTQRIQETTFVVPEILNDQGECESNSCPSSCPEAGDINPGNGNVFTSFVDASDPSPMGIPLSFSRAYNSRSTTLGAAGYGWTHSYSDTLTNDSSKYYWLRPDGRSLRLVNVSSGVYKSENDKQVTLQFVTVGGYTEYDIILPDGTKRHFDRNRKLTTIKDRFNNQQTLTYTGSNLTSVADNFGRSITFEYNASGRMTAANTPAGRFEYTYDTNNCHRRQ